MMRERFRQEYTATVEFFVAKALRCAEISTWAEAREFFQTSTCCNWVYVILFSNQDWTYAFGTASKDGRKLKNSGLFQRKLTGKYDRRGEYLMLRQIYGSAHQIRLFEIEDARKSEGERVREICGDNASGGTCLSGFAVHDRDSIVREIFDRFKMTVRYRHLFPRHARLFEEFIYDFYLAKLKHPHRNASFHHGDCMEPNFLGRTLARNDIEEAVALALDVEF
jgi:hypothetical protein